MTIKKILLHNCSEGMILAQDVVDEYGRTLIASGISLKQELIRLLRKHDVHSVIIETKNVKNHEIDVIPDVVSVETRLRLIASVKDAFSEPNGLARHLCILQSYIEDIVRTISQHKSVLMYLNDIDYTSEYLFMHSVNVGLFSIFIGKAMGLSHMELCLLGMGGLLHDFGKTRIAKEIIDKKGKLTIDEFNEIKEHSSFGYNLLRVNPQLDHRVMFMALQHHERCDGSGYPWGILQNKIHPLSRIVAVADVYDALTSDRVYRTRMTSYEATAIINQGNNVHFDADVITAFNQIAVPYQIGCNVTLNNGKRGNVIRLNTSNLLRPFVETVQGIINLLYEPDIKIIAIT